MPKLCSDFAYDEPCLRETSGLSERCDDHLKIALNALNRSSWWRALYEAKREPQAVRHAMARAIRIAFRLRMVTPK